MRSETWTYDMGRFHFFPAKRGLGEAKARDGVQFRPSLVILCVGVETNSSYSWLCEV